MRRVLVRGRWIAAAAVAVASALSAAPAQAHDYNVSTGAEFLTAVATAATTPDNDRIFIAAGEYGLYAGGTGMSYSDSGSGTLEIAGQGDSTVLKCGPGTVNSTLLRVDAAPGSSIHDVRFGSPTQNCASNYVLLAASGVTVRDASFYAPGQATAIAARASNPTFISHVSIAGDEAIGGAGIKADDTATVTVDRASIKGIFRGFYSQLSATWTIRNSLVDLGSQDDSGVQYPAGALFANETGGSHVNANLANVTIVGTGHLARGIDLQSFADYTTTPYPTINVSVKNSIVAMTGLDANDLSCPTFNNDYSVETVAFDRVAANPATFVKTDCPAATNTNSINRAIQPLLLGSDLKPAAGSSAIDSGDPAFVPLAGELDLAGNCRKLGAAVDLGAYEFGTCPMAPPSDGGSTTAITLKFGKVVGKLKIAKKAKALRKGTKKSKPRIPVTLSAASEVTFTLAPKPKSAKKKPKALKGSLKLKLPAGRSFLTWSGKWGKKTLKPGKYKLSALGASTTLTLTK